jgi:hypothetical protein
MYPRSSARRFLCDRGRGPAAAVFLMTLATACRMRNPAFDDVTVVDAGASGGHEGRDVGPEAGGTGAASGGGDNDAALDAPLDWMPDLAAEAGSEVPAPVDLGGVTVDADAVDANAFDADAFGADAFGADASSVAWPPVGATKYYSFENGVEAWEDLRFDYYKVAKVPLASSTTYAWQGGHALEIPLTIVKDSNRPTIGIRDVNFVSRPPAGATITYHVWIPTGSPLEGVQPYVLYWGPSDRDFPSAWGGDVILADTLPHGQWISLKVKVPNDVVAPGVAEVGIEWRTVGAQILKVYVDGVSW